jgi:hypothetical protein
MEIERLKLIINAYLDFSGKSMRGLSREIGGNEGLLKDIFSGRVKVPKLDTLKKLSQIMGTTVDVLTNPDVPLPSFAAGKTKVGKRPRGRPPGTGKHQIAAAAAVQPKMPPMRAPVEAPVGHQAGGMTHLPLARMIDGRLEAQPLDVIAISDWLAVAFLDVDPSELVVVKTGTRGFSIVKKSAPKAPIAELVFK